MKAEMLIAGTFAMPTAQQHRSYTWKVGMHAHDTMVGYRNSEQLQYVMQCKHTSSDGIKSCDTSVLIVNRTLLSDTRSWLRTTALLLIGYEDCLLGSMPGLSKAQSLLEL